MKISKLITLSATVLILAGTGTSVLLTNQLTTVQAAKQKGQNRRDHDFNKRNHTAAWFRRNAGRANKRFGNNNAYNNGYADGNKSGNGQLIRKSEMNDAHYRCGWILGNAKRRSVNSYRDSINLYNQGVKYINSQSNKDVDAIFNTTSNNWQAE